MINNYTIFLAGLTTGLILDWIREEVLGKEHATYGKDKATETTEERIEEELHD